MNDVLFLNLDSLDLTKQVKNHNQIRLKFIID